MFLWAPWRWGEGACTPLALWTGNCLHGRGCLPFPRCSSLCRATALERPLASLTGPTPRHCVSAPPKLAGKSQRIQLNGWGKVGSSVRSSPGLQSSHAPNPNFSCQAFLTAWWDAAWCGGHKGILVMPLLALIYSLTLGKSLHVSGPEHPYLQNSTSSTCKALWCKDESCHLRDM